MSGAQVSEAGQPGKNLAVAGNLTQLEDLGNVGRNTVHRISLVRGEGAEFPVMRGMVQRLSSWKRHLRALAVLPQLCKGA